eukprot:CAMPEP_0194049258 /NCGR_PEP_ID=MMETSP0009_2-20130614/30173_1 /TAXON_ID=210454 /ORGANISM="Grammatophora oceanica, Strain CCMP 410" /LENGTH=280 /DNA_ID=CAMNT_0038695367 /DNA_START=270 /DNA_END=1112 /DNA_ORIENTATION=+
MVAVFAVWGKWAFIGNENAPGNNNSEMHSAWYPIILTVVYAVSLPLMRVLTQNYISKVVDVKLLLRETMIIYNGGQVLLNMLTVWQIFYAIRYNGHPLYGDLYNVSSGATYAVWIHYCDKYLEFFDTYFMVLRGKMDQVTFLHVYHHVTIAWAWYLALCFYPGGDAYFGALLNSIIHVMMYSYYTLALLKVRCPWKKYLTVAQLTQFVTVFSFTCYVFVAMPPEAQWNHYAAVGIQLFEMASLFLLFMVFFRKTYRKPDKKKPKTLDSSSDSDTEQSVDS